MRAISTFQVGNRVNFRVNRLKIFRNCLVCSLIIIEVFSFLQRARTEDSFYIEKLLKSDGFVNVEMLSNTGELAIVSSRNNVDSFLPEKKNDIEMTDRTSERGMMSCKNKRARLSVGDIIDRISRLLFPLAFISFNVSYWNHYLSK